MEVEPEWLGRYSDWTTKESEFDCRQGRMFFLPLQRVDRLWGPLSLISKILREAYGADHSPLCSNGAENSGAIHIALRLILLN
jgi:hypothetical protein